jgi:hypothetical protein
MCFLLAFLSKPTISLNPKYLVDFVSTFLLLSWPGCLIKKRYWSCWLCMADAFMNMATPI